MPTAGTGSGRFNPRCPYAPKPSEIGRRNDGRLNPKPSKTGRKERPGASTLRVGGGKGVAEREGFMSFHDT
jgi:hypothetical protein